MEVDGVKILVTHGHRYGVKTSLTELEHATRAKSCQIAFFGHSHVLGVWREEDILLINPGSLKFPKGAIRQKTYAIVRNCDHTSNVTFYNIDGEIINLG